MFDPQSSEYLVKRQRKEVLENLGRVAVVGMSTEPIFRSYGLTQKLIQYGVKILPIIPNCASVLGLPCYDRLQDVPGAVDVVQVYRQPGLDLLAVAQATIDKKARVFWIENDEATEAVRQLLAEAKVFVVEHESLETEYRRHCRPFPAEPGSAKLKPSATVSERMTRHPVTVKSNESLQDALTKMKKGHFRHLPVLGSDDRLVGMLSDRDLRRIRRFFSAVPSEERTERLAMIPVQEATVFTPVAIMHDASLEEAAELMLRWGVGALPVLAGDSHLVGIITYVDLLRELLARKRPQPIRAGEPPIPGNLD